MSTDNNARPVQLNRARQHRKWMRSSSHAAEFKANERVSKLKSACTNMPASGQNPAEKPADRALRNLANEAASTRPSPRKDLTLLSFVRKSSATMSRFAAAEAEL